MLRYGIALACVGFALAPGAAGWSATWKADETGAETIAGRRVVRFEHDCLKQWGYTEKSRQYFYVIEPKIGSNGPLLVCLHSAGGNGKSELAANVEKVCEAGDEFTGLMLNSGDGPEWWWGWNRIEANPDKYKDVLTPVENRVLATVEWVAVNRGIDRNRIYMRGISMGGSGTLGIGMTHGDVFAALLPGVPAWTKHATYRLSNSKSVARNAGRPGDVPPVFAFFSPKDPYSEGMEQWFALAHREKLSVLGAWGPWGHLNHYEMTDPAAYEFPWLSIRKNQAYPAFTDASSDSKYPGHLSDGPDQSGQMNAYFRWTVIEDQAHAFSIEMRLVQARELAGTVDIPMEAVANVTPRRLQRFEVKAGKAYAWSIEQAGRSLCSGEATADAEGLVTIPKVKITARPIVLHLSGK